jgi:hypothetical protein
MHFQVHGPFEIPRDGRRVLHSPEKRKAFWSAVEKEVPDLSSGCGCYVFTIRGQVWYVGLAERQTFRQEIFSAHKVMLYGDALSEVSGTASMIFLAKVTNLGRLSNPASNKYPAVRFLEDMLIGLAIQRNPKLLNIKGTKLLKNLRVPGIINTTRGKARSLSVQSLKKALGV